MSPTGPQVGGVEGSRGEGNQNLLLEVEEYQEIAIDILVSVAFYTLLISVVFMHLQVISLHLQTMTLKPENMFPKIALLFQTSPQLFEASRSRLSRKEPTVLAGSFSVYIGQAHSRVQGVCQVWTSSFSSKFASERLAASFLSSMVLAKPLY